MFGQQTRSENPLADDIEATVLGAQGPYSRLHLALPKLEVGSKAASACTAFTCGALDTIDCCRCCCACTCADKATGHVEVLIGLWALVGGLAQSGHVRHPNIGTLIIRIGFWSPLCYNNEPPKIVLVII